MTIAAPTTGQGTQTMPVESNEIWSTILTGVASSKMVPTKKLLVLGKVFFFSLRKKIFVAKNRLVMFN